jgi:hypothetical protein
MAQESLTKEQTMNAINLVATMAVSDLAQQKNECPTKMLLSFMASRTASVLYDADTKFWCDGPLAVEEAYLAEKKEGKDE